MALSPYPSELANLVKVATDAAGREAAAWPPGREHETSRQQYDDYTEPTSLGDASRDSIGPPQHYSNGSRDGGFDDDVQSSRPRKRKRISESHVANQFETPGLDFRDLPTPASLSEARSAGVHSAAALFRRPSATSKRYTRPPMSKMFTSLQLSPENFLHLQAAAKGYMLDPAHPERRDTVGQRGRGDSEMVKLRLYNCVKNFLEAEGHGEMFFGDNTVNEGMGPREFAWPRDQHKIISLVIPLLRRMVTNERQRQYAVETRKGGSDEHNRGKGDDAAVPHNASALLSSEDNALQNQSEATSRNVGPDAVSTEAQAVDKRAGVAIGAPHSPGDDSPAISAPINSPLPPQPPYRPAPVARKSSRPPKRADATRLNGYQHATLDPNAIMLHINVVSSDDIRLLPRLDLPSSMCPNLEALVKHTSEHAWKHSGESGVAGQSRPSDPWANGMRLKVWLADGLVLIQTDGEWMVALLSAGTKDWMDGELRVIIEAP